MRRSLMSLVALAVLLAACAPGAAPSPTAAPAAKPAATAAPAARPASELQVITSAVYKKSFDEYVIPKMKELYNVNVVASQLLSAEALARAIGQKDRPQISVFMLDAGPWLQGKESGLWEKLDASKVTNLQQVPTNFKDADGQGTAMMLVMLVLVNLMLSPEYQKVMAETDFMGPINPQTQLGAEFAKTFPVTREAVEKSHPIPWEVYNAQRVALNERWQREIEGQ